MRGAYVSERRVGGQRRVAVAGRRERSRLYGAPYELLCLGGRRVTPACPQPAPSSLPPRLWTLDYALAVLGSLGASAVGGARDTLYVCVRRVISAEVYNGTKLSSLSLQKSKYGFITLY